MITAPTYDAQQVSPQQAQPGLLNATATSEAAGAALGAGLASAAGDIGDVVAYQKAQADDVAVSQALTALRTKADQAQAGYANVKGAPALAAADAAQADFDKFYDATASGLTADQRRAFDKIGRNHRLDFHTDASRYSVEQMNVAADGTYKTGTASLVEQASRLAASGAVGIVTQAVPDATRNPWTGVVANAHDETGLDSSRIESNLAEGDLQDRAYAAVNARRLGMDPATFVRLAREERHSMTHQAVVNALMAKGDATTASAYFDKFKGDMDAQVRTDVQGRLTTLTKASEAATVAQTAFQKHYDASAPDDIGTQTAAGVADIRSRVSDPAKREDAITHFRAAMRDQRAENEAVQNDAFNALDTRVESGGEPWAIIESSPEYAALDGKQRASLKTRAQQVDAGDTALTDPLILDMLRGEAANPETALSFANRNLRLFRHSLAPADLAELDSLQKTTTDAITKGDKSAKAVYDGFLTEKDVVDGYAADLYPGTDDEAKASRINFTRIVNQETRSLGIKKSAPLDRDEIEAVAKRLAGNTVLDSEHWIWNDADPFIKVVQDEGIDPLDALEATDYLQAHGVPVNLNTIRSRIEDMANGR